eukprot:GFKZ01014740.1.p1 GENE.GFKZ01014740.1~~GFKZ01014740.1.p1  ORF type:complete len:439 (+),score=64.92 GFKZ01014740.1:42-1358(+)
MPPRVFVTGIGLVTPLGVSTSSTWTALLAGNSAVRSIHLHPTIPVNLAARVDRSLLPPVPPFLSPCPEFSTFALVASREALLDAALLAPEPLQHPTYQPDRAGVSIGVGMANIQDAIDGNKLLEASRYRRITPFLVSRIMPATPAGLVALRHILRGPIMAPSTACAASAHAIADGYYAIQRGDADVMVVGGTEALVNPLAVAGFARAKALSTKFNDQPQLASRPFDRQRDGFVIADGAGIMVLESEAHVKGRGASVYAEVVGVGITADAFHITSPPDDGGGALKAMEIAVRASGREATEVDYVNAHATSTPIGDAAERRAIASLLAAGKVGGRAVISSTKGATGHMIGAAGGVEGAFTVLAVAEGVVPPTINLGDVDEDEEVERLGWGEKERYVPVVKKEMEVQLALSNSFGFGGMNTCIAFARAEGFDRKNLGQRRP